MDCYVLNKEQIQQRYPAFLVPDGRFGLYFPEGGVFMAAQALEAATSYAKSKGAEFRYGSEVTKAERGKVTLANGEVVEGVHVVMCCGPKTFKFNAKEGYSTMETEVFTISDPTGLPPSFYEFEPHLYSGLSGSDLGEYKIG